MIQTSKDVPRKQAGGIENKSKSFFYSMRVTCYSNKSRNCGSQISIWLRILHIIKTWGTKYTVTIEYVTCSQVELLWETWFSGKKFVLYHLIWSRWGVITKNVVRKKVHSDKSREQCLCPITDNTFCKINVAAWYPIIRNKCCQGMA